MALAAQYGALSVDHLEQTTEDDARLFGASGTVAVLLPGAYYTLRESQSSLVAAFRVHKVPMALATDCNNGSLPLNALLLALHIGCTLVRLTPNEALLGVICHTAQALGLHDAGTVAAGIRADLAIWNVEKPAKLSYRFGFYPLYRRVFRGTPCN